MTDKKTWNVCVVGGAGYVGSVLVPKLLEEGHKVTVLDLYLYGEDLFSDLRSNPNFREVKGDMRDMAVCAEALNGCNAVIHLACISNDPSFELDPGLGKSINYDCFRGIVKLAKQNGVKRFVYASSSSVYGVKDEPSVTEELSLEPLTDYSKYKVECEKVLTEEREPGFTTLILRPSTVCGYAPRLRLDLTVNILTCHAITKGKITVFGGNQKRPNIHIQDMAALYCFVLQQPDEKIDGKIYNAGYDNFTVMEIAEMVRGIVGKDTPIEVQPTNDNRSYHVSSEKIRRELGFLTQHSVEDAIRDLSKAFSEGKVPDPLNNVNYYNIKRMQQAKLK